MKLIIVTGGVLSGLGKGVAAASIGHLLTPTYRVVPIKCDGYLNVDPGTMNPLEHGEVFVLSDGSEVDMDFGHYERFLDVECTRDCSITMGKVFAEIQHRERRGDYLGSTVQFIPHVTNQIKDFILEAGSDADVVLLEIGGTIGDLENELYVEAARQLRTELGKGNCLHVHLTYVPTPAWIGEQKTKPTQQSVQLLLQRGLVPDLIIARGEDPVAVDTMDKIQRFTGAEKVISGHDVDCVYEIPINFLDQGILPYINERLSLDAAYDGRWQDIVGVNSKDKLRVAIAGKYTALEDSYASVIEALRHASMERGVDIEVSWIDTENLSSIEKKVDLVDAVIVPGGFGDRGIDGKIEVIRACRVKKIPFLGICYGMQLAVVEFARNVCGLHQAHSTEVDSKTPHPVVAIMDDQLEVKMKGGTMRLGSYKAELEEGQIRRLYGSDVVSERHRHRYEINPKYHGHLSRQGLRIVGKHGELAEFVELTGHPYFVATQAHPELQSRPEKPAPLFSGLIRAGLDRREVL